VKEKRNPPLKIILLIIFIVVLIIVAGFVVRSIFYYEVPEERKQPFFVNCTYYLAPNETYAIINITTVIKLADLDPRIEYFDFIIASNTTEKEGKYLDKDSDGMVSKGDQFVAKSNKPIWYIIIFVDVGDYRYDGIVWDSRKGPIIWNSD